ncbi:MAG TPA: hypothetical protein VJ715_06880 [Pyrinomonadaceae bacterium]|nr:hypothetical protein [Pyrinomonadaceae bacterium]
MLTLLLSLSCYESAFAQNALELFDQHGRWANGVSEAWRFPDSVPKEEIRKLISLWESIAKDNQQSSGGEWAGDYFIGGETHGSYMRWSLESGFVSVAVNKCEAKVVEFSYGKAMNLTPVIQLTTEQTVSSGHSHGRSHSIQGAINFVPVKYRGERILIPEDKMSDFGDYVAGLGDFNGALAIHYDLGAPFFYKLGPVSAVESAVGGAVVPQGYEKFLKKPVETLITKVNKRVVKSEFNYEAPSGAVISYAVTYTAPVSVTSITLDAGSAAGIKRGMVLWAVGTGDEVRITRADPHTSVGIIVRNLNDKGRETFYDNEAERERLYPRVRAGWKLTTSPF